MGSNTSQIILETANLNHGALFLPLNQTLLGRYRVFLLGIFFFFKEMWHSTSFKLCVCAKLCSSVDFFCRAPEFCASQTTFLSLIIPLLQSLNCISILKPAGGFHGRFWGCQSKIWDPLYSCDRA